MTAFDDLVDIVAELAAIRFGTTSPVGRVATKVASAVKRHAAPKQLANVKRESTRRRGPKPQEIAPGVTYYPAPKRKVST